MMTLSEKLGSYKPGGNVIIQKATVSLDDRRFPDVVHLVQYDNSLPVVEVSLALSGQAYKLPDGASANIRLEKPDGKVVYNAAVGISENRESVYIEITEQMTSVFGDANGIVEIVVDGKIAGTGPIVFQIDENPVKDDSIVSSDEFSSLDDLIDKVNEAEQAVSGLVSKVENIAPDMEAATRAANEAAQKANDAADGAEKVNVEAQQLPNGVSITVTDRTGKSETVELDTIHAINSWYDVRNALREGFETMLFPVGHEFRMKNEKTGVDTIWVVRGYSGIKPADPFLQDFTAMILETKLVYGDNSAFRGIPFSNAEALYYAEEELPAGTYKFKVVRPSFSGDKNKYFNFTLAQPVPAGGHLFISGVTYNTTIGGKTLYAYKSFDMTENFESSPVQEGEGADAIDLGETDSGNLNAMPRMILGSNNYCQSEVRQFINSTGEIVQWKQISKFAIKPTLSYPGFAYGFPQDFLDVVQPAVVNCTTNSTYESPNLDGSIPEAGKTSSSYTLNDKFFLLSSAEMFGTGSDGEQLDYYKQADSAMRIKYDVAGTPKVTHLRTPYAWSDTMTLACGTNGASTQRNASYSDCITVGCIIA